MFLCVRSEDDNVLSTRRWFDIPIHLDHSHKVNDSSPQTTPLVLLSRIWVTGYYDPGRLRYAGSEDNDLSVIVPISTFVALYRVRKKMGPIMF